MTRRVMRGFSAGRFTDARRRRGLSVPDLARLADVGTSTIYGWEARRGTPQIDLLARIMQILNAPISDVVIIPADERYPGDWRTLRGLTQPQLAHASGIATNTLAAIERADIKLTDGNARTLARLLGIEVDEYRRAYQRARERHPGAHV
jgi:transcriptional regulator with XRE-family HTH domain